MSGRKQKEKCTNNRCAEWLEYVSGEARRLEAERDEARRLAEEWQAYADKLWGYVQQWLWHYDGEPAPSEREGKNLQCEGPRRVPWEVGK